MIAPEIEWLKKFATYALRIGYEIQSGRGTNAPTLIWADADYEVGDGKCGLHEGQKGANEPAIPYVRLDSAFDLADAAVAAAYEAAAELARKCWHDPESEFSDAYVPDAIHALTPADAKAALEAVRREAKAEALREAAGSCDTFDGPVSDSDFVAGQSTAAQQIRSAILALLDNPQEDET